MASIGFKYNSLTIFDSLDDNLWEWYISEFELALVLGFLKAHIEDVHWPAERSNSDLWAVSFPGAWCHRVVVFYDLAADFIPLGALGIEIVHVKSIEVADNSGFTCCIELGAGKLLNFLVFGVVESLEAVTGWFIESNLTIVSSG